MAGQRQALPHVVVLDRSDPVLSDHPGSVRSGAAPSDGQGRKPPQARWSVVDGARLQHGLEQLRVRRRTELGSLP